MNQQPTCMGYYYPLVSNRQSKQVRTLQCHMEHRWISLGLHAASPMGFGNPLGFGSVGGRGPRAPMARATFHALLEFENRLTYVTKPKVGISLYCFSFFFFFATNWKSSCKKGIKTQPPRENPLLCIVVVVCKVCVSLVIRMHVNEWGEPTASYSWTCWIW